MATTRRRFLKQASVDAAGLGFLPLQSSEDRYVPPPERDGGWRVADPKALGINATRLRDAIDFHDTAIQTTSYGGALAIVYKGHIIGESYTTGTEGGPQMWTAQTCNDMKSSTKSVFGTAVGVFLEEYKDQVNLDTYLVGASREDSLIPQIWDQAITDERKKRIKIKHAISMTSGHESREPWVPSTSRHLYPGYSCPFQMYEYCFG